MSREERRHRSADVAGLLREDKCFLLAVLDSPVQALNARNIRLDDESLDGLLKVTERVRAQAIEMLADVAGTWNKPACNACNNCCVV